MRRTIAFLLAFILCFAITGCNGEIKTENENLKNQVKQLSEELDEIKNGAQKSIIEIRNLYEKKDYDNVIEKSKLLHERFNGSNEDVEAQKYVKTILNQREAQKKAEQKKREQEAEAARKKQAEDTKKAKQTAQDRYRSLIRIKKVWITEPNSAGGVDLYINWVNNSNKVIKYASFTCNLYNAVNDMISCDIRGYENFTGQETGPINKGKGSKPGTYWECAWYNNSAHHAVLTRIEIEYMDGTKEIIPDLASVKLATY